MSLLARSAKQVRWIAGLTMLVTVAAVIGVSVYVTRGHSTADDAVRRTCHPAHIVRDVSFGVMWTRVHGDLGSGWIASIKHDGGGYVVVNCKFKSYVHA